jgi:hypothetical protein
MSRGVGQEVRSGWGREEVLRQAEDVRDGPLAHRDNQSIFSQPNIDSVQGSQTKRKYALKKPHAMRVSGRHAAGRGASDEMCCETSTRTVSSCSAA